MAQVENARELLFAMLALIFGLAAWWIGKPYPSQLPKKAENDDESTSAVNWFENSRLPQCFSRPPLPLVSVDRSIWAIPLTRTSIVLASFATLVIVSGWLKSNVESGSLPLLVSSIALLLATGTFRLGRNASEAGSGEFQAASDVEQALRAGLMLAALTAFACGVYAGVESSVLAEFPRRVAWGWYQVLAVFLVFGLWCVSIVFAAWTRNRLARTPLSEMQRQSALSDAAIYSTLPHALSWLLALSLMVLGTVFAFASSSVMLPSAITLFAGGVTLALMAGSQQSWFSAYAALAALVVAIVMLPMMASGSSLWTLRWSTELLSLLGILGALSALVLTRSYFSRQGEGLSSFPDLARMPHAELSQNWPAIWFPALRDFSLACVALSTSIAGWHFMLGEPALWEPARILGSCFLIAATFFVLPKLYEVAWPTYVGCLALILGTFPAVELIGQPMAILCIAWAVLGLLIWAANLAIERHFRRYVSDSDNSPQFVQWYQRPLLRSSSVVAILAVVVALATATTAAWQTTPLMAALACMLATINLLLCARSANVIHRATLASGLVYLACAVTAICTLVLVSTSWNLSVAALSAAILSLAMVIVGVILVELDRRRSRVSPTIDDSRSSADSQHSNWQDVFGQPIAFSGLSLAFVALAISISRSLGANLISDPQTFGLQVDGVWFWHQAVWQRTAASLLLASLTWLVGSRSYVRPIWIHLGVCCGMIGLILFIGSSLTLSPAATGLVALLVANCLIGIARWIHVHPTQAENIALAKPGDTELSFFAWPLAVAMFMLGFQAMHLVNAIQEPQAAGNHLLWLLSTLLTAGFFFQALYQQPKTIWLNMLIAATSVAISLGGIVWGRNLIPADIGLAVLGLAWGGLALRIRHQLLAAGESKPSWIPARLIDSDSHRVMAAWSTGLLLAALTTTFPVAWFLAPAWPSCSLTFLLVATGLAAAAWVFRSTLPIPFAMALLPASIGYATYFYGGMAALVEYAGPMLLSLSIAYGIWGQRLTGRSAATDTLVPELGSLLKYGADIGIGLSLAASLVLVTLNAFGLLAALTMLTAAGCWLWRAFESGREAYVYFGFASLMVGILAAAHLIFGLPFGRNALLSLTVVGISFACMGVNILAGRNLESSAGVLARPTYYIALWFPLCLLATIPFDNREITAYCALAGGAFYLFVAHQKQSRWPVYIATILFNVAIYIWMPVLKESTGLFQLYVIPVAISILLIAQLHRQELKHSTLNAIRYAAAGAILATSTLEVFMTEEPSLMRFVVVLMFSLMGTAAGIALRVRPFVFLGLAFMTLNVLGQLGVQFQREGGIIRAVILIAVGILVLAAMIFFNIHRERLLKRYRHFLADSQWE
ncbi:MAG: hypothetical protein NXI32_23005 [bacterium]|nr:hypothetical protein [bacterium]